MSWEDCGFKPGKINGPKLCPKGACGDCDGEHHFLVSSDAEDAEFDGTDLPDDFVPEMRFQCKHCDTTAEMVDEDEDEPDTDKKVPPSCACKHTDARTCMQLRYPLFDDDLDGGEKCECPCHREYAEANPEDWELRP